MKLLLDEQISGKVAERLRKQGREVVAATADATLRGLSDPDLFDIAQHQKRAIVTYDRRDPMRLGCSRPRAARRSAGGCSGSGSPGACLNYLPLAIASQASAPQARPSECGTSASERKRTSRSSDIESPLRP